MDRIARMLLRLAPRRFRERYADELLRVHRERLSERRAARRVPFAVRETLGIASSIVRMRLLRHSSGPTPREERERDPMFRTLIQDARFALRTLTRSPGYTAAAVLVLSLGLGANTAMFSTANALFFRPLPFADEDHLYMLYETNPEFGWTNAQAAPANFLDWRERVEAFQDVAAYSEFQNPVTYILDGQPVLLNLSTVSGNFFEVLGVPPIVGRGFRWEETWDGADDVVVLSHRLWESMFGADPAVVGQTLQFGTASAEIVGVMPPDFTFPIEETDLWTPWGWNPADREAVFFRRAHFVRAIARLAPGVTPEQADAELQTEVAGLQQQYPETNRVMGAGMAPLRTFLVSGVRTPVLVLVGAVAALLLLACVNVANLALIRAVARRQEVALRNALGAGRSRIATLLLVENLLLALVGGALGLALGWGAVRAIDGLASMNVPAATTLALDHRVLLFTGVLTTVTALLFGAAPVLLAMRSDLGTRLKEGGRGASGGPGALRLTGTLVAVEVALAVLLVAGAGLMVQTALRLRTVDPGFRTEGVLAVRLTVPAARYVERDDVLAFYDRLLESLEARPGIERAGTVGQLPLAGPSWSSQFQAEGWPADRVGFEILHRRADRGYFEALGVPLVRGRFPEASDRAEAPFVVVVNETFAREHFPGEDPIGQRIAYDRAATASSTWYEIVGIVGDQSQMSPALPARAEVFESRYQDWARNNWVVLRTSGSPLEVMPAVRETLRELDPLIPISEVRPLRDVWRSSMAREELVLVLLGAFAALALLLAAVGVYAVTAQSARRRTREIGIRIALGAVSVDVARLVLRQGMGSVVAGLVVGVVAALLATRALSSLLFGVGARDPGTLAAVALLLLAVGAVACWIPARWATRLDPVRSLRIE
jgi:putative ABC transport system permease protein